MLPSLDPTDPLLWTIAFLVVLCVGVAFRFFKRRRDGDLMLHDSAISTLVFPPASKFQSSVLPRQ
jgi:hypothetical protein